MTHFLQIYFCIILLLFQCFQSSRCILESISTMDIIMNLTQNKYFVSCFIYCIPKMPKNRGQSYFIFIKQPSTMSYISLTDLYFLHVYFPIYLVLILSLASIYDCFCCFVLFLFPCKSNISILLTVLMFSAN